MTMSSASDSSQNETPTSNLEFASISQSQLQQEMEYNESMDTEDLADPNHAVMLPTFNRVNDHSAPNVS